MDKPADQSANVQDRIDAFWAWWGQANGRIAAAIDEGKAAEIATEISARVDDVDPSLAWELGPGVRSKHHLCVSSEGNATLRVLTERWLTRAPEPDDLWEYYPARQAVGSPEHLTIVLAGTEVPFSDFRIALEVDEDRERVDVGVWHPMWRSFDPDTRGVATYVALDNALGEDSVECWVGGVERLDAEPEDGQTLSQLKAVVDRMERDSSGERWAVLRGEAPDGTVAFISANLAVKRTRHLLFDNHYELTITLREPRDDGLVSENEAPELDAMEEELIKSLGPDAVYIGRETTRGVRKLHLHASGVGPAPDRIDAWMKKSSHDIELEVRTDPDWGVLRRW